MYNGRLRARTVDLFLTAILVFDLSSSRWLKSQAERAVWARFAGLQQSRDKCRGNSASHYYFNGTGDIREQRVATCIVSSPSTNRSVKSLLGVGPTFCGLYDTIKTLRPHPFWEQLKHLCPSPFLRGTFFELQGKIKQWRNSQVSTLSEMEKLHGWATLPFLDRIELEISIWCYSSYFTNTFKMRYHSIGICVFELSRPPTHQILS